MSLFGKNRKKSEIFKFFNFWYRLIGNAKIRFLLQILFKYLMFKEVMSPSVFTDLQGYWPGFKKILVGSFQNNDKVDRVFRFCHFMPYMIHWKGKNNRGSRKIFSIWKTEHAEGGAVLQYRKKLMESFIIWRCKQVSNIWIITTSFN